MGGLLNGNYFNNPRSGPLTSDIGFKNSYNQLGSGPWAGDVAQNGTVIGLHSEDPTQVFTRPRSPPP